MNPGDTLAQIAETQIGTRGDLQSGRAALYGYLLATDAKLNAFEPEWTRQGFGTDLASRHRLLDQPPNPLPTARFRLLDVQGSAPDSPVILRIHSWCAAFVDWCVMQLLLKSPQTTSLALSHRPRTASAFGLLQWGKSNDCRIFDGNHSAPERGDIAVFTFSHTGVVTHPGHKGFFSVEGNTTPGTGGNQGYLVEKRWRAQGLLKGFVRLPPKERLGDFNIPPILSRTA
jgi:hypothetical protein